MNELEEIKKEISTSKARIEQLQKEIESTRANLAPEINTEKIRGNDF